MHLEIEKFESYHVGYLMYFFMKACAMSAYLMDVNPFDQPGVEFYKKKQTNSYRKTKTRKHKVNLTCVSWFFHIIVLYE